MAMRDREGPRQRAALQASRVPRKWTPSAQGSPSGPARAAPADAGHRDRCVHPRPPPAAARGGTAGAVNAPGSARGRSGFLEDPRAPRRASPRERTTRLPCAASTTLFSRELPPPPPLHADMHLHASTAVRAKAEGPAPRLISRRALRRTALRRGTPCCRTLPMHYTDSGHSSPRSRRAMRAPRSVQGQRSREDDLAIAPGRRSPVTKRVAFHPGTTDQRRASSRRCRSGRTSEDGATRRVNAAAVAGAALPGLALGDRLIAPAEVQVDALRCRAERAGLRPQPERPRTADPRWRSGDTSPAGGRSKALSAVRAGIARSPSTQPVRVPAVRCLSAGSRRRSSRPRRTTWRAAAAISTS